MWKKFPFYQQHDSLDCGPACLRMVSAYYGRKFSAHTLRQKSFIDRQGVSILGLNEAAQTIGMRSLAVRIPHSKLDDIPLPCIAHWQNNHFIVVHKIKRRKVYVADPAHGLLTYSRGEFVRGWVTNQNSDGVLLLLEPTPDFFSQPKEPSTNKTSILFLLGYLLGHKKAFGHIITLMFGATLLQLALPFLTRAIVDRAIPSQNISLLIAILGAQFMLFIGRTTGDFLRSRLLLHIGTRINIAIISDFLEKLMKLPLSFFNKKTIGDLLQRVNDHYRIEGFLTSTLLGVLFAVIQLLAFGAALAILNQPIFWVFLVGSLLNTIYVLFFLKWRRNLDYKRFTQLSNNQSMLIQLIRGMPEIKLNGGESQKQWQWQQIQENLYGINIESLKLGQLQQGGAGLIGDLKNIFIVFLAATAVIWGDLTLGSMMAIQYIVGQLNMPIMQLIGFVQAAQDTQLSLERLKEVHDIAEEDLGGRKLAKIPPRQNIAIKDSSFSYGGPAATPALTHISTIIPGGKTTAIVGHSGSGKTSLLKLLLKFYRPLEGKIMIGNLELEDLCSSAWRKQCGVVMQDGYIFSDTIARNIAISGEEIEGEKLFGALKVANIYDFVQTLPAGVDTKIGNEGLDLSQGQIQRILIARAVYKDPAYLFFDEATNSLDTTNERVIMNNLHHFFRGRTVLIIAHRLSTVQKADQILVLERGEIIEQGTHNELILAGGAYYQLVKDQLEIEGS